MSAQQVDLLLAGLLYNGTAINAGTVNTYEAGTTTPKATYTDANKVTAAANPLVLDSQGRAAIYAEGSYKFVVKDSSGTTLYTWDNLFFARASSTSTTFTDIWAGSSTGSSNAYAITVAETITTYTAGKVYLFLANHTNTATATLNINGIGTKVVTKGNNKALTGGEIVNGHLYAVLVNPAGSTTFQLIDPFDYLANNVNFKIRNNADSADVNAFKVNTSDKLEMYPHHLNLLSTATPAVPSSGTLFWADTGTPPVLNMRDSSSNSFVFFAVPVDVTPTYSASGAMTYTTVTTTIARFQRIGKGFLFWVNCSGTTGGVASTKIYILSPYTFASGSRVLGAGYINDGGLYASIIVEADGSNIAVSRADGANWGLGAGRQVNIFGYAEST